MGDDSSIGFEEDHQLVDRGSGDHVAGIDGTPVTTLHEAAVLAGEAGYIDPSSGLFVLTSAYLAGRGTCCASGCRHCPYPGSS